MNLPESREEGLGVPTFPRGSIGSEINVQPILVSTQLWTDPARGLCSAVDRNMKETLLIFFGWKGEISE